MMLTRQHSTIRIFTLPAFLSTQKIYLWYKKQIYEHYSHVKSEPVFVYEVSVADSIASCEYCDILANNELHHKFPRGVNWLKDTRQVLLPIQPLPWIWFGKSNGSSEYLRLREISIQFTYPGIYLVSPMGMILTIEFVASRRKSLVVKYKTAMFSSFFFYMWKTLCWHCSIFLDYAKKT